VINRWRELSPREAIVAVQVVVADDPATAAETRSSSQDGRPVPHSPGWRRAEIRRPGAAGSAWRPRRADGFLLGASLESAELAARLDWNFVFAAHLNGDSARRDRRGAQALLSPWLSQ
jgi:hypothetical protein